MQRCRVKSNGRSSVEDRRFACRCRAWRTGASPVRAESTGKPPVRSRQGVGGSASTVKTLTIVPAGQYIHHMPERDLVSGVAQLSNLLTRRLGPLFEKAGITPQQWAVLSVLGESGDAMSLAAIGRAMLVSKQNMTGMVARLEQLGLAERSGDPADLRSSRVQLTRRGRALVEKMKPLYQQWIAQLGGRDVQGLARSINRLIEQLQQTEEE